MPGCNHAVVLFRGNAYPWMVGSAEGIRKENNRRAIEMDRRTIYKGKVNERMSKNLKVIPLGGLGEIGKNMTVIEYGRNQIIVDCGVMFPESDLFGIDLVLPKFDYILKNQGTLRGLVLTHGHQDHIGGVSYLLNQLDASFGKLPIYGTDLTLGMLERKLIEMGLLNRAELLVIDDQQSLQLGPFRVSPFE